jgi:DNA-damage-inducible protein J
MPAETTMIHVRIDHKLKTKATRTLNKMGLSMSDAVRLFLTRVEAEKALPFEVRVPNATTIAAMKAGDRGEVSKASNIAALMADLNADD